MQIYQNALRWLEIILSERFGHRWHLERFSKSIELTLDGGNGKIIFDSLQNCFFDLSSDLPFTQWDASKEGWKTCLFGPIPTPGVKFLPEPLIENYSGYTTIHYDIFGLLFWVLNRIEEIGQINLDQHNRFHAKASHAYRYGYLERPVLDEWLYILGQVFKKQWASIKLRDHSFKINVSHDVDYPSRYSFQSWSGILRGIASNVLIRRDFKSAVIAPWVRLRSRNTINSYDPANTFDWIMDISDRYGLKSAFFFICGRTEPSFDSNYEPEHPAIRALISHINKRGHEIGLHPSYNTYKSEKHIIAELNRLHRVADEAQIIQEQWGGRMHYLRWEHPTTLVALNNAGISYDTTLGYADQPGFRCGTCFEYPAFNPVTGKLLSLRIRPLIVMETTILSNEYLGLGTSDYAFKKIDKLKQSSRAVNGIFTLLWHNCQLQRIEDRMLYESILSP